MQDPEIQEAVEEKVARKSPFTIIVTAVAAVVVLAAAAVAYGIFSNSYNANLDKLKAMVADTQAKYQSGDTGEGVTLAGQADYYATLAADVESQRQILQKLNDMYPLLLGRATEKSLGLAELKAKLTDKLPQIDTLRACIAEDDAVTAALSAILARGASAGQTSEYATLTEQNNDLVAKLGGISFDGKLEEGRAALNDRVNKRVPVLAYLADDAKINEEIAKLSADTAMPHADLKAGFTSLLDKNDALLAEAAGIDLTGYGSGQVDIPGMIAERKTLINAYIEYMGELDGMKPAVAAFCASLEGAATATGKFTEKLASYMTWVTQLKDLRAQLDAINAKEAYKGIEPKRSVDSLGMTPAGQKLLSYEDALNAINSAVATSKDIEAKTDNYLAEKKMDLPDKISAIEALLSRNNGILSSIAVEAPEDMKAGLENFKAGCTERVKFLNEFMEYVEDQQIAAGCSATISAYNKQRNEDLNNVKYWKTIEGDDGPTVKYYEARAAEKKILINEQSTLKNAANKNAAQHKAAYEASRKTYQPLLDQ